MINLLKLHIFLLVAGFLSIVTFFTVYVRRYTDASYHEVGTLMFFCSITGTFTKPLFCSLADRYRSYRGCLLLNLSILFICTIPFTILPFRPQLFFKTSWLRYDWYLMASIYYIYFVALGVTITLSDVYMVDHCAKSNGGEHLGQYRVMGSLGGLSSMFTVTLLDYSTNLPYLAVPMLMCNVIILLDLVVVWNLDNIDTLAPPPDVVDMKDVLSGVEQTVANDFEEKNSEKHFKLTQNSTRKVLEKEKHDKISSNEIRKDLRRITIREQLELIYRMNRYDNFSLFKYLMALLIVGAFAEIHNVFFLASLSGILEEKNLSSQIPTLNAVIQVASQTGEMISLLWYARLVITLIGRDGAFMYWIFMSGLRYTINGYLATTLNHWIVAGLDFQTGLLWGLLFTLNVGIPASYLKLLDRVLLSKSDENQLELEDNNQLKLYLSKLRETHSDDAIRFAVKATMQSMFSGVCEGMGFGLGPFLAGFWLGQRDNSILLLFQDLGAVHVVVLVSFLVTEFGIIRFALGIRTKSVQLVDEAKS